MSKAKRAIEHRACPNCDGHVAVAGDERPAVGRCFDCDRSYSVLADESVHALCACDEPSKRSVAEQKSRRAKKATGD